MRDQWVSTPLTDFSPAGRGEPSAGHGELDSAGRQRDWNTRSPDVVSDTAGSMPPEWSSGGDLEWGNPVETPEQGGKWGGRDANQSSTMRGQFDSESRGGSSDWVGRDREWHSSSPALGGQSIPVLRRGGEAGVFMPVHSRVDWSNRGGTLDEGVPNESPGMAPRQMMYQPPDSERASSGPIPFADEGDYTMKRKRGESPMNMGGPPFDDRRQPSWEGSEIHPSPAARQFHSYNPPPQAPIGDGSPYGQQHFAAPPREWMGGRVRGRGRGRGSIQGNRRGGRGDFGGRSDFGHHAGRGLPPPAFHDGPPPPQFHDGPPFPDAPPLPPVGGSPMVDRDTAGSLGHYGKQVNDISRIAPPGRPPPGRPPLPPGGGPSGGGFNRYQGRDGGSFHPPPNPPMHHHGPPPPHGMPPRRESDSSLPWNTQTLRESISAGSSASLAESGPPSAPFMDDSMRGDPKLSLTSPPISDVWPPSNDSKELDIMQNKPSTPTPTPTPAEEVAVAVETPKSPPSPVGPPSGLMLELTRLADLESQLDFALAKHAQLVRQRELLEVQTEHLKTLPVGVDAFQEELTKLIEEDK